MKYERPSSYFTISIIKLPVQIFFFSKNAYILMLQALKNLPIFEIYFARVMTKYIIEQQTHFTSKSIQALKCKYSHDIPIKC